MEKMYQDLTLVGVLDAADQNAGSSQIAAIDMSLWSQLLVILDVGVANAASTITITPKDSPTSGGSYTAIPNKTLALTAPITSGTQYFINILAEEMNAGARFIEIFYAVNAHSTLAAIIVLGKAAYAPAGDNALSTLSVTP
jgi:hypothetical protein